MSVKVAFVGIVGVPANYGGFETLVEQLLTSWERDDDFNAQLTVFCEKTSSYKIGTYKGAIIEYSPFKANGWQSILHDVYCAFRAAVKGHTHIVMLGVSGAIIIPFIRMFFRSTVITNCDGIEWKRAKWNIYTKILLYVLEYIAVRCSHITIADNICIEEYLRKKYDKKNVSVIEYGGNQADDVVPETNNELEHLKNYALALCRIEPENNVEMILKAFTNSGKNLVFVGNWSNSTYGVSLYEKFGVFPNITLLNPIYSPQYLKYVRKNAVVYVHGHSAGGTNPALVEMMCLGVPVFAYGCDYNRATTENQAFYFNDEVALANMIGATASRDLEENGNLMKGIGTRRYSWNVIARKYKELIID
jgi:glycosyltransferase involved in cell wall biosynthesis